MFLEASVESEKFLIVFAITVGIIIIGLLIYFFINKGKNKKENVEIKPNFETNNNEVQNESIQVENNKVEEITIENQKIDEEIPEEVNDQVSDIESMLQEMQHDLDDSKQKEFMDGINRYEDEEEENAIISYKELMKFKESQNKEIVLEEKTPEELKKVIEEKVEEEPKREEVKKFKRSEFISPIFGLNDDTNVTYKEIKRPPKKEPANPNEWESDRILRNLEEENAEVVELDEPEEPKTVKKDKNDSFYEALVDFRNKLN